MPLCVVKPDSFTVERTYGRSSVVSLFTDCKPDEIPENLRNACDHVEPARLSIFQDNRPPDGVDAALLWLAGERLLEGTATGLRSAATSAGGRSFAAVHLPCFAEVDLIGLQPRLWKKGMHPDATLSGFRISGATQPSPLMEGILNDNHEIWALLYSALLDEQKVPGAGLERLSQLWRDSSAIPRPYAALLIRNLIVLLIHHKQHEEAERMLKLGMDNFPLYAELPYLAALLCAAKERYEEVPEYVLQATQCHDPTYVGSGGEHSYRSLWLLGWTFEIAGKQEQTVKCYLAGVRARPAYPPSVYGILRQRLPHEAVQQLRYQGLGTLALREPQYLEPIFEYFLLHRLTRAARYILESSKLTGPARETLQKSLDEATTAHRPPPAAPHLKPGVMLVGPFCVQSSLARINREIAASLMDESGMDGALEPFGFGEVPGNTFPHFNAISKGLRKSLRRIDLTIRHHWPPSFQRPECGKLAVILPWEFGSIPQRWADEINSRVDELWVPSEFCKLVFARGGVSEQKIQVIPNGIDGDVFTPEGHRWRPRGCRGFVFLFVGGAIPRKGIDVLWGAYRIAFNSADDVTLVIKDIGSSTFYKRASLLEQITNEGANWRAPHCVVLTEELDDHHLASLYRGADVIVLPYRGEGFGMPLVEGLACGRPVITTGLGPAPEFCPPQASFFISAKEAELPHNTLGYGPLTGPFTWFEPNVEELAGTMRWLFEHRDEAAQRGRTASETVRTLLSWKRITSLQLERVRRLIGGENMA